MTLAIYNRGDVNCDEGRSRGERRVLEDEHCRPTLPVRGADHQLEGPAKAPITSHTSREPFCASPTEFCGALMQYLTMNLRPRAHKYGDINYWLG